MPAREAVLEPLRVGDIRGHFWVPGYQRGYRWGRDEVGSLLNDISGSRQEDATKPYYLQPVVVKKRGDGSFELVDGQQRLTTLFLIYQFMMNAGYKKTGARYTMEYETRPGSAAYLQRPDPRQRDENIDYFHISRAYDYIDDWFEAQDDPQGAADEFYGALRQNVRVIWYEAPAEVDGNTLFRNLNVGRIRLTDAELVKALLLSRSPRDLSHGDRTHEIAAQWDVIERDMREPELWAFATGRPASDPTHIDLLLNSLVQAVPGRDRRSYATFEDLKAQIAERPNRFWDRVVERYGVALGWYASREVFHKIGYLIAQKATTFRDLQPLAQIRSKSDFQANLDEQIKVNLNLTRSDLLALEYGDKTKVNRVLLLMNVETVRRLKHSTERYSFQQHAEGEWSLEHIHAQSAEGIERKAEQWKAWLEMHRRALTSLGGVDPERQEVIADIDLLLGPGEITEAQFLKIEPRITRLLSGERDGSGESIHSIANLALLDCRDNSAIGNSTFAAKRHAILDRDRDGQYIPVCTRYVFLKYYSGDERQIHFWSSLDRQAYLSEMTTILEPYLVSEETAS